jgi:hypothetical protein
MFIENSSLNKSYVVYVRLSEKAWIPAFAGMTSQGADESRQKKTKCGTGPNVIPAKAGIHAFLA